MADIRTNGWYVSLPRCPQDSDVLDLHRKEVEKGGMDAVTKYRMEHPEVKLLTMKHDPLQNIG